MSIWALKSWWLNNICLCQWQIYKEILYLKLLDSWIALNYGRLDPLRNGVRRQSGFMPNPATKINKFLFSPYIWEILDLCDVSSDHVMFIARIITNYSLLCNCSDFRYFLLKRGERETKKKGEKGRKEKRKRKKHPNLFAIAWIVQYKMGRKLGI